MPSVFQLSLSLALQINPENPLITVILVLQGDVTLHKATVNVNIKLVSAPFENCNLNKILSTVLVYACVTLTSHWWTQLQTGYLATL